ncbi:hypothetical protein B0H17DRAFT_1186204 [Mycena rosella]|uniref:Uncharacterized protein n=1 Tax=Mycena rosella TaxID=1033263 RepID=A0AAD7G4H8_MYCRO|nr:hypothetical protein B0H17DRAFT_1186204 [Mycena rosella]
MPARRPPHIYMSSGASSIHAPFKDLLYTNIVPSEDECQAIRNFVAAPIKERDDLSDNITQLQIVLEQLTLTCDALFEFIDSHLALVTSARKIPEDILREIFTVSLPTDGNATIRRTESPLGISRIFSD